MPWLSRSTFRQRIPTIEAPRKVDSVNVPSALLSAALPLIVRHSDLPVPAACRFRLRIFDVLESGFLIPGTTHVLALREVEHQLHRFVRWHISEHRIGQLAHPVEGFHEHVRVSDLRVRKWMSVLLVPSSSHALVSAS